MRIVHSEDVSKEFVRRGGELEIIQLWVNLPSKLKMKQPRYQGFQSCEIPSVEKNGLKINVISGSYGSTIGSIESVTEITACTIEHTPGSYANFTIDVNQNLLVYQLHGLSKINGIKTGDQIIVAFSEDESEMDIEGVTDGIKLMVAGTPIREKAAQHGPFVMHNPGLIQA